MTVQGPRDRGYISPPVNPQASPVVVGNKAKEALADVYSALVFLQEKRQELAGGGMLQSMKDILRAPANRAGKVVTELSPQAQTDVAQLYGSMVSIYQDGLVSNGELTELRRARTTIQNVLQLQEFRDSKMLGELAKRLFGPLQTLEQQAAKQIGLGVIEGAAADKDVLARITPPFQIKTSWIDLDGLRASGKGLDSMERYNIGDYVGVRRSDGSISMGVVQAVDPNALWAAFRTADGHVASREITRDEVLGANPLKIGDAFTVGAKEVIVTGFGADGKMTGEEIGPAPNRQRQSLGGGQIEALAAELTRELQGPPIGHAMRPSVQVVNDANHLVRAGNVETNGVEKVVGGEIALSTIIGPKSKYTYNEDAAVAGQRALPDGTRLSYLGVFDQAGGMGKLATVGQASKDAAESFVAAVDRIANEGAAAPQALRYAAKLAHEKITDANIAASSSACTTYVGAVVTKGRAVVAACGDSRALLVGADGTIKERTLEHNAGRVLYQPGGDIGATANIVTSALGGRKKGADEPTIDTYDWKTERGDWLVVFSDGVGDANQLAQEKHPDLFKEYHTEKTAREIAWILKNASSPEDAAAQIQHYVALKYQDGSGKADNVSVVVQRITE